MNLKRDGHQRPALVHSHQSRIGAYGSVVDGGPLRYLFWKGEEK